MAGLLKRKSVRDYALKRWKHLRPGWEMTRVSNEHFVDPLEQMIRWTIDHYIMSHPSVGRTIKMPKSVKTKLTAKASQTRQGAEGE